MIKTLRRIVAFPFDCLGRLLLGSGICLMVVSSCFVIGLEATRGRLEFAAGELKEVSDKLEEKQ